MQYSKVKSRFPIQFRVMDSMDTIEGTINHVSTPQNSFGYLETLTLKATTGSLYPNIFLSKLFHNLLCPIHFD